MAGFRVRDLVNGASSWEVCMSKSYCKWPVIAGIAIGGLLLIPIVWCCGRLICCHTCRSRAGKVPQNSKQSSVFHPPPSQGYKPAPQPPPYESPKSAQLDLNHKGTTSPETPRPWPGNAPENLRDEDVELGRLDRAHAPDTLMLAHQEPTPMARLSPINTQNPHHPLHRPHDSLQHPFSSQHMSHTSLHSSHNSMHAQNPFSDPLATDYPPHMYRPPSPPRPYSPYFPQRPYSPYLPYSPVSPYTTGTARYDSSIFVENQQPYRAYSPSVSTHYEPSSWNEPVELPSPYNKRPESLIFAEGTQTQLVESKATSDALYLQPEKEPQRRASPTQPESKDILLQVQQPETKQPSPKASRESQSEFNLVTGSASPPARSATPGRAL